jgi:hypothetical protein
LNKKKETNKMADTKIDKSLDDIIKERKISGRRGGNRGRAGGRGAPGGGRGRSLGRNNGTPGRRPGRGGIMKRRSAGSGGANLSPLKVIIAREKLKIILKYIFFSIFKGIYERSMGS